MVGNYHVHSFLNWLALEFQENMIMISEWHPNPWRSPRYLISAEVPAGIPQKWLREHIGSHKTSQIHGKFLTTSVSLCHVYPNKHPAIGFGKRGFHYGQLNKYTVIPLYLDIFYQPTIVLFMAPCELQKKWLVWTPLLSDISILSDPSHTIHWLYQKKATTPPLTQNTPPLWR